ncbi:MAG TPA: site-2 protease family protein [Blastocatellia bacterium]|nr:site-2 protease family protein [Blastocatellia bacterium]
MESTNQPYLIPEVQPSQPVAKPDGGDAVRSVRAASRGWLHLTLLAVTAVTTMLTGIALSPTTKSPPTDSLLHDLVSPILLAFEKTMAGDLAPLTDGLLFTFTLIMILGAHELGHYFACKHYGIKATLPFFIPAPPIFTLFGTFGAVIKIKEPITTRRALFDIGIAGPLAGFALALPASIIGLLIAEPAPPPEVSDWYFDDPGLFRIIMLLFDLPRWIQWNPVYWAAWGTLLVTALNLFPVGQLDGGHVVYALFGRRVHKWVSRAVCASVIVLAAVTMALYSLPVWILWSLVLLFMLKVGHPPVSDDEPLGKTRITLAIIAAIIFLLCFMYMPLFYYVKPE